jgi:hypothetical protein
MIAIITPPFPHIIADFKAGRKVLVAGGRDVGREDGQLRKKREGPRPSLSE